MNPQQWNNISKLFFAIKNTEERGKLEGYKQELIDLILPVLPQILADYDGWDATSMLRLKERVAHFQTAENQLSNAYIRLRVILDAINTCQGTTSEAIWEHTEARAQALVKSHTQLQWALRNLLAHTRDVEDRCFGNGDGYQSEELERAIKQADALVGVDVTDTFPIADDVLYRRIEELEVALAAEKAKKQGRVMISKDILNVSAPNTSTFDTAMRSASILKDKDGEVKVQLGYLGPDAVNDMPQPWSEKQLRDLVKDAIADALKPGGDIHHQYCVTRPSRKGL